MNSLPLVLLLIMWMLLISGVALQNVLLTVMGIIVGLMSIYFVRKM